MTARYGLRSSLLVSHSRGTRSDTALFSRDASPQEEALVTLEGIAAP